MKMEKRDKKIRMNPKRGKGAYKMKGIKPETNLGSANLKKVPKI